MAHFIHCIKKGGKTLYREWTTFTDCYTSDEGFEDPEELSKLILEREIRYLREDWERHWPERIARAQEQGTSEHGDTRSLKKWDKERR